MYKVNDENLSEWAVGIDWFKTFLSRDAKTFVGIFANQNIVCKLRDERTLKVVHEEFGTGIQQ